MAPMTTRRLLPCVALLAVTHRFPGEVTKGELRAVHGAEGEPGWHLLTGVIAATLGSGVRIVDSAATTAAAVRAQLERLELLRPALAPLAPDGALHYLATDGVERFAAIGGRFLGQPIDAAAVELIDL